MNKNEINEIMSNDSYKIYTNKEGKKLLGYRIQVDGKQALGYIDRSGILGYIPLEDLFRITLNGPTFITTTNNT